MSESKFEIIKKIGVLSKSASVWAKKATPSAFGTSPKYDTKRFYDHQTFYCRIWGRTSGGDCGWQHLLFRPPLA